MPSGSGTSRPRCSTNTVFCRGLVGIIRGPSPSSRARVTASGFWVRMASGPASSTKPSTTSVRITPPSRGPASSSRQETPSLPSAYVADIPAMPPPITATSTRSPVMGVTLARVRRPCQTRAPPRMG